MDKDLQFPISSNKLGQSIFSNPGWLDFGWTGLLGVQPAGHVEEPRDQKRQKEAPGARKGKSLSGEANMPEI